MGECPRKLGAVILKFTAPFPTETSSRLGVLGATGGYTQALSCHDKIGLAFTCVGQISQRGPGTPVFEMFQPVNVAGLAHWPPEMPTD